MLSRKKLFNCIDTMISNFYNEPLPLKNRLSNFHNWLACSFQAGLLDFEDYNRVQAYGYEKIKNMDDYNRLEG